MHEEAQLSLLGPDFGDVDMEVADRVALELLLDWLVAFDIGQAGAAVAFQAAVQG